MLAIELRPERPNQLEKRGYLSRHSKFAHAVIPRASFARVEFSNGVFPGCPGGVNLGSIGSDSHDRFRTLFDFPRIWLMEDEDTLWRSIAQKEAPLSIDVLEEAAGRRG